MGTAIVTGCRGAIGGAICAELKGAGYDIIGLDRPPGAEFAHGLYLACDLAHAAAVAAVLAEIRSRGAKPVLLVNNAGYYDPKPFFETSLEDFAKAYDINVRAIFQLSQEVARWMVADDISGAIVNIASIAGKIGSPIVPYGTTKAAVLGLTRSLAKVLAPSGIRVNAIAPGVIASPMSQAIDDAQMRTQLAITAMGRVGVPEEIATVTRFLASADASYMTGSIVDVAGGWMS